MLYDMHLVVQILDALEGERWNHPGYSFAPKEGGRGTTDVSQRLLVYDMLAKTARKDWDGADEVLSSIEEVTVCNLRALLFEGEAKERYLSVSTSVGGEFVAGTEYWCEALHLSACSLASTSRFHSVAETIDRIIAWLNNIPEDSFPDPDGNVIRNDIVKRLVALKGDSEGGALS